MSYCNICTVNITFLNYLLLLKSCRFFKLGHNTQETNTLNNLFGKVFYVFLLLEHLLCVLVVFSCLFLFITYFLCLIFITKIISTPRIAPYIIIISLTLATLRFVAAISHIFRQHATHTPPTTGSDNITH